MAARSISVLAGNAHFQRAPDGTFTVDTQPHAFAMAMRFVQEHREQIACIGIAVDHKGSFSKQFLPNARFDKKSPLYLSSEQRKRPRLCHVQPEIMELYGPILKQYDINPADVLLLTEEMDRSGIRKYAANTRDPRIFANDQIESPEHTAKITCNIAPTTGAAGPKANCDGLTAEVVRKLAMITPDISLLRTFWQANELTVKRLVVSRGTKLAYQVFKTGYNVRIHIVETIVAENENGLPVMEHRMFIPEGEGAVTVKVLS